MAKTALYHAFVSCFTNQLTFFVAGGGFFDSAVGSQFAGRSESRPESPNKAAPRKAAPKASASGIFLAVLAIQ